MKRIMLISLVVLALAAGCATPEANRWKFGDIETDQKYQELAKNEGPPKALVYCYEVAPPPAEKPEELKVTGLSDRGQEAYVQAMAKKSGSSAALREDLGTPLGKKPEAEKKAAEIASTSLKRTMVISVSKGLNAATGDRLSWAQVEIRPVGDSFTFTGYTVAATEYDTIDIANVTRTRSFSLGAKLAPTLSSSVIGTGEIGSEFKAGKEVTAAIKQTYTKLDVGIQPCLLRITREGERSMEVNGNTFIKLTLKTQGPDDRYTESYFLAHALKLEKDGVLLKPGKASAAFQLVRLPAACPLKAKVRLIYELRQIKGGAATYVEGDDIVNIKRGVSEDEQVLVPTDEIIPPLWGLKVVSRSEAKNGMPVVAQIPLQGTMKVVFTDYLSAKAFALWLSKYPVSKLGKVQLFPGKENLKLGPGDRVVARRIKVKCTTDATSDKK